MQRLGNLGLRPIVSCRHLHYTVLRRATEVPRDPLANPAVEAFYEKIRNHQGAVDAMLDMRKIMQSKGGYVKHDD